MESVDLMVGLANIAAAGSSPLFGRQLSNYVDAHYDPDADTVENRPYMVEAIANWWADVTALTVASISAVGAPFLGTQAPAALSMAVAITAVVFLGEAVLASPYEYQTNSLLQRILGILRRLARKPPPTEPRTTAGIVVPMLVALVYFLAGF